MARSDVARSAVQRAIAWTNVNDMRIIAAHALVAQLDRVLPSEGSTHWKIGHTGQQSRSSKVSHTHQ